MQNVAIFWSDGSVTMLRSRHAEKIALHWLSQNRACRMIHCYHNHRVYFSEYTERIN